MWRKLKNLFHLGESYTGKLLLRGPIDGLTFIGITGTDGKTTTSNILYHLLTQAGYKTALISTISAVIDGTAIDTGFHVTTPNPLALQMYINKARKSGAKYIILEVTSHALDQYRVHGIPFTIGVLTNITKEHLDYHKTYEKYLATKVSLLEHSKHAIINADDGSYPTVLKQLTEHKYAGKIHTYSLVGKADITAMTFPFETKLLGEFNKYNILAAVSAAQLLGIENAVIKKAVASFSPPVGRTEIVYKKDFTVMIDFAHTPNSLLQILKTIQLELLPDGKIIHVFGSAGERDSQKRKDMGKASALFADSIVLTAEDPRTESVSSINKEIEAGIADEKEKTKRNIKVMTIPDRREAIREAILLAKKGDVVVITGKGHEKSMNLGNGEIPWSEHEAVNEAISWKERET